MQKNSFILYTDILPRVERLSREQAGELFVSILRYAETSEEQSHEDPVVDIMYGFITDQIARHTEKYKAICQRRSEYAKKRWNKLKQTPEGDTERERERDSERERESERVRVPENETDRVRVCERVRENELPPPAEAPAPAPQGNTPDNTHNTTTTIEERIQEMLAGKETPSVYAVIGVAGLLGYNWSAKEAQRFLDYNKTKNRKDNWEYAIRRWEEQRSHHKKSPDDLTDKERAEMEAYVSLGHSAGFPKRQETDG